MKTLAVWIVLTLTLAVTTTSTTTTTQPPVDHFQCYEIKPKAFAPITGVSVQDQFGPHTETILFPHRLCAPADKRDEDPTAPTHPEHLIGHVVSGPRMKVPSQTVVNQFGTIKVDVVRPDILLVPTLKTLSPPGPPSLAQPTVDHFQCYKVKRSPGAPKFQKILGVKVDDQFGTVHLDLLKPLRLCAPANKRNEDPTAPDHPGHLLCYKTRNSGFGTVQTFTNSQFGPAEPLLIHRRELCVPALKNPSATTTTTSTSTTSTTTTSTTTSTTSTSTTSTTTTSTTTSTTTTSTSTTSTTITTTTTTTLACNPGDCNDHNACTVDTCDPASGCVYTAVDCNDFNVCTVDACDPADGCFHQPRDCNDDNACTDDTCDPAIGCVHTNTVCDDHIDCTLDFCDQSSGCINQPDNSFCSTNDPCKVPVCDRALGCTTTDINCNDNNPCTTDVCVAGRCQNAPHNFCNDNLRCTDDVCVPDPQDPGRFSCNSVFDPSNCNLASCQTALCAPGHDCEVVLHDDMCTSTPPASCFANQCTAAGCVLRDICGPANPQCNGCAQCTCSQAQNKCVPSCPS